AAIARAEDLSRTAWARSAMADIMLLLCLNRHAEVGALVPIYLWPVKREDDAVAGIKRARIEVGDVGTSSRVSGRGSLCGLPAVAAPMHRGGGHDRDPQGFAFRDNVAFVVEAPLAINGCPLLDAISLYGLRWLIENLSILQRSHELDVLRVRPYQRTR